MHGIDIVDLEDENFRNRDERALRLIINDSDVLIDHPHLYWLLWSAKEAVFKCNREAINYSPTSIPICLKEENGDIAFSSNDYEGKFEISDQYILAICSDRLSDTKYRVLHGNTPNGDLLRKEIISFFHSEGKEFEIGADELNLPILLPSKEPISISHHGKYGAFSYQTSITI